MKRLFDPNNFNDNLPGDDDVTLVGNETYVTKRNSNKPTKISSIFKPKLVENQLVQENGCDDSFGRF